MDAIWAGRESVLLHELAHHVRCCGFEDPQWPLHSRGFGLMAPLKTPQTVVDTLERELARIVAAPGFNRWLVPPAALAIHLSIGMAYGLSVFWLPLSKAIGSTKMLIASR